MAPEREISAQVLRARRTAAFARAALALFGIALTIFDPDLGVNQTLMLIGFGSIFVTSLVQLLLPSSLWLQVEESFALPAIVIVGLGGQNVTILTLLWLAAVACGVLARGGRVHWVGRAVVVGSLLLPIALEQRLTTEHAGLIVATIALLLTCGRVTQELSGLLSRARYDADHDSLTGALARAAFRAQLDRLAPLASRAENAALLVIDLDNFGQVNKSNGHAAGDALLSDVVATVRHHAGPDAVIGRLGGDEFAVVVHVLDVEALAHELMAGLDGGESTTAPIGSSIGVARIPDDGRDAETLLRAADIALRVAKRSGKQQVSFYAGELLSDHGPAGARSTLLRLIEGEGLSIAVQPIVDLTTGSAHAFEALARFPAGGPLHWLALADEFGLRAELELACLRVALSSLDQRPLGTLMSINLSGSLLPDPRTEELLAARPSLDGLILEITENSLVENTADVHAAVTSLLGRGVSFAIDDVGAGYSGLRQLTTINARYLKLDRSLVTNLSEDPGRCALIAALLGYARQTGSFLVAEGVENPEELATVMELGVPLVQGYYLGRPGTPWPETDPSLVTRERRPRRSRPARLRLAAGG